MVNLYNLIFSSYFLTSDCHSPHGGFSYFPNLASFRPGGLVLGPSNPGSGLGFIFQADMNLKLTGEYKGLSWLNSPYFVQPPFTSLLYMKT